MASAGLLSAIRHVGSSMHPSRADATCNKFMTMLVIIAQLYAITVLKADTRSGALHAFRERGNSRTRSPACCHRHHGDWDWLHPPDTAPRTRGAQPCTLFIAFHGLSAGPCITFEQLFKCQTVQWLRRAHVLKNAEPAQGRSEGRRAVRAKEEAARGAAEAAGVSASRLKVAS